MERLQLENLSGTPKALEPSCWPAWAIRCVTIQATCLHQIQLGLLLHQCFFVRSLQGSF